METVPTDSGPVTVVVSRHVKPGLESDYERWIAESITVMQKFPGFLGASVTKPTSTNPKWVFMPRWVDAAALDRWDGSPELEHRLRALEPLIEGGTERNYQAGGLDFWFPPPPGHAKAPGWKMMVVTVVVMWPSLLILGPILAPISAALPWFLSPLPMLAVLIPLMEYVLMPGVIRIFRNWLFPKA